MIWTCVGSADGGSLTHDAVGVPLQIGSGWNMFNEIMVTNDWIGNGLPNLIGRKSNGELWLYNSNGSGG